MPQANAGPIQRLAGLGLRIAAALAFLAPLLTRLVVGFGFHATGHGKLQNLAKVTGFFSDLGIPFPGANAHFIAYLEFIGGLCLIAGLGTRIFAFLLSCTMVVDLDGEQSVGISGSGIRHRTALGSLRAHPEE
jgi:putative oxidoreductase